MNNKIKSVSMIANIDKPIVFANISSILKFLASEGVSVLMEQTLARHTGHLTMATPLRTMKNKTDLILVLGGDGTFLHAAGMFHDTGIPMVGINFGAVGFLNEIFYKNYKVPLKKILSGGYASQKRMMLKVVIGRSKKEHHCLNDLVFIRHTYHSILDINCSVNNKCVGQFRADGVIISTPTGSTAYSLSAQGPVLTPLIDAIIINPLCAHELAIRPLVVDSGEKITLDFSGSAHPPYLAVDGRKSFVLKLTDKITVSRSEYYINIITSTGYNFYDVLSRKLGWIR